MVDRINHAHSPLTPGRSLIPPTLPILLHIALIQYLPGPWDPQTGNVYMDSACLFGSRFPSLYNALVVHFSLLTLLLCFPCFAASRHFALCSVDRRLLPILPPITTLIPYNPLLTFILVLLPRARSYPRSRALASFPTYLTSTYMCSFITPTILYILLLPVETVSTKISFLTGVT